MPHTAFIVLLFPNVIINGVTRTLFLDKRGTTIPRNSWNSKDARGQAVQRREPSTSCKGLCCSFTSLWNDLGVWHFKRDQRGSHISIRLHHSQLIAGNLRVVAFGRICNWSRHCKYYNNYMGTYQLTICQNKPAASAPKMEPVSFAELREMRMTKVFILPEEGKFGQIRPASCGK